MPSRVCLAAQMGELLARGQVLLREMPADTQKIEPYLDSSPSVRAIRASTVPNYDIATLELGREPAGLQPICGQTATL